MVFALLIAACSSGDLAENIIESQEGIGDVKIDESDGSVEIEVEDEDGNVTGVIGGGDMPDGFLIPAPAGGDVTSVFEAEDGTSVSLMYSGADFDDVAAFYEEWVDGSGLEVFNKLEISNPKSVAWSLRDGDAEHNVSITETGPDVFVVLFAMNG